MHTVFALLHTSAREYACGLVHANPNPNPKREYACELVHANPNPNPKREYTCGLSCMLARHCVSV